MDYKKEYERWLANSDEETKKELLAITDEKEIEERFYKNLEFGTAGLRGIIGAGTNRMNLYVVGQATQGLCDYLKKEGAINGVVIAYDSRIKSREFAKHTALVLANSGIKAYLFTTIHPVPMLSFAIRHIGCDAGIVITASHNPKEYNGYKVYGKDGGQMTPYKCKAVTECIEKTDAFTVKALNEKTALEKGLLEYTGDEVDSAYYDYCKTLSVRDMTESEKDAVTVAYTPLHGSGLVPVTTLLSKMGYKNVFVAKEQEKPDGNFPTVKAPNPESPEAFDIVLELAKNKNADIAIATDPDSDRMGVAVKTESGYTRLTGNKIGAFLIYYLLTAKKEEGKLCKNSCVVKSVVSTPLADAICEDFGVQLVSVLTGFRYIAEHIEKCDREKCGTFVFGFEESYGFLSGTQVRDKDGVLAAMLMTEACAYFKTKGKTLCDVLHEMDEKYGTYLEAGESFKVEGKNGMEKLKSVMEDMHAKYETDFCGRKVLSVSDYKTGICHDENGKETKITLPDSDMIYYKLRNAWVCMRPSGTEPKLKIYVGVNAKDNAKAQLDELYQYVVDMINRKIGK